VIPPEPPLKGGGEREGRGKEGRGGKGRDGREGRD